MITAEEFVRCWQNAETLEDVCQITGLSKGTASAKAATFRKRGVNLKRFRGGNVSTQKWAALSKLAKELS